MESGFNEVSAPTILRLDGETDVAFSRTSINIVTNHGSRRHKRKGGGLRQEGTAPQLYRKSSCTLSISLHSSEKQEVRE
jgi:hypothetical protein